MDRILFSLTALFFAHPLFSENTLPTDTLTCHLEEVEITASRIPLSQQQTPRIVRIIDHREIAAAPVQNINDLLKFVATVDVRQRGEFGIQTDISLRGGTFDQITLLLNGVNINNPQTGHLSADIPVNLNDIERIEILNGPAARVFGTSAFTGAINIVTKKEADTNLSVGIQSGQYGLFKAETGGTLRTGKVTQHLSGAFYRSDGAVSNSDFSGSRGFYQGYFRGNNVEADLQLGVTDKGFGANTFYSPKYDNQYEHVRRYLGTARIATKGIIQTNAQLYWHRTLDRFELFRSDPASWYTGHNYHRTDVTGMNVNLSHRSRFGKSALGAEVRHEEVISNVLGKERARPSGVYTYGDQRTDLSIYAEHHITKGPFSLSAGLLGVWNSALKDGLHLYPGIDLGVRINDHVKLYGSWNRSLRMPTFTDLYYKSATNEGNPNLKPEKNEAFEIGSRYENRFLNGSLSLFYQKGSDMIDWIRETEADEKWKTVNHTRLNNMGVESTLSLNISALVGNTSLIRNIDLSYAYIRQDKETGEVYKSNYALEYLRHKFTARLMHRIWSDLQAVWGFRWQERMGGYILYEELKPVGEVPYRPYGLVDVKLEWSRPVYQIYVEANNLFNHTYVDLGNIPQPGIWIKCGVNYRFSMKR